MGKRWLLLAAVLLSGCNNLALYRGQQRVVTVDTLNREEACAALAEKWNKELGPQSEWHFKCE